MQEPLNEKISLLIDDELNRGAALALLKKIQADESLKSSLERYQLISQILKTGHCARVDSNFAQQIHQQIKSEPIYFLPAKKAPVFWRKTSLAVAASVVLAVVWMVNKFDNSVVSYQQPQFAAVPLQTIQPQNNNGRLNDYLQAHDNSVYINNVLREQPYARVVGYQQE